MKDAKDAGDTFITCSTSGFDQVALYEAQYKMKSKKPCVWNELLAVAWEQRRNPEKTISADLQSELSNLSNVLGSGTP